MRFAFFTTVMHDENRCCATREVYILFLQWLALTAKSISAGRCWFAIRYCLYFSETRIPPPWTLNRVQRADVHHSDAAHTLLQQRRVTVQEETRIVDVAAADVAVESPKV